MQRSFLNLELAIDIFPEFRLAGLVLPTILRGWPHSSRQTMRAFASEACTLSMEAPIWGSSCQHVWNAQNATADRCLRAQNSLEACEHYISMDHLSQATL